MKVRNKKRIYEGRMFTIPYPCLMIKMGNFMNKKKLPQTLKYVAEWEENGECPLGGAHLVKCFLKK